jgi:hypothetical protein
MCMEAASKGHFTGLQFAHENGCPCDDMVCDRAAIGGHLEYLQCAHEHGC